MPHMTLEYSTNVGAGIDSHRLFSALHVQLADLSCVALKVLSEHFHEALTHGNCDIAVQITELERESYARVRSSDLVEKA